MLKLPAPPVLRFYYEVIEQHTPPDNCFDLGSTVEESLVILQQDLLGSDTLPPALDVVVMP